MENRKVINLGKISWRSKLIIAFFILVFLPIHTISFTTSRITKSLIKTEVTSSTTGTIAQTSDRLDDLLNGLIYSTKSLQEDEMIKSQLQLLGLAEGKDLKSPRVVNASEAVKERLAHISMTRSEIESLNVYLVNGGEVYYETEEMEPVYIENNEDSKNKALQYEKVFGSKDVFIAPTYRDGKVYEFSVLRKLVDLNNQYIGIAKLDINEKKLENLFDKVELKQSGYLFIVDKNNKYIAHSKGGTLTAQTEEISQENLDKIFNDKSGSFVLKINKRSADIVYHDSDVAPWSIVGVIYEDEIISGVSKLTKAIIIIGLGFVLAGIIFSYYMSQQFTRPMKKLIGLMSEVSKGNLVIDEEIQGKNEFSKLGQGFIQMVNSMKNIITEVKDASKTVLTGSSNIGTASGENAASSEEISKVMQELAKGASEQAKYAEESVSAVNKLVKSVDKINKQAELMNELSNKAKNMGHNGANELDVLEEKTKETRLITNEVSVSIDELNSNTSEIRNIVNLIEGIATQINLLSLNAAIEAARAGEHGRGFAVVADEVRKLAEQSQNATKSISSIINDIQEKTDKTVQSVKNANNMVEVQAEVANRTGETFRNIVSSMDEIIAKIEVINSIIKDEVIYDTARVSDSIQSISAISQQSAAATEEASSIVQEEVTSAEELANEAGQLNQLAQKLAHSVEEFKIN